MKLTSCAYLVLRINTSYSDQIWMTIRPKDADERTPFAFKLFPNQVEPHVTRVIKSYKVGYPALAHEYSDVAVRDLLVQWREDEPVQMLCFSPDALLRLNWDQLVGHETHKHILKKVDWAHKQTVRHSALDAKFLHWFIME